MIIENLLECSADKLIAMSTEELHKYLDPYLHVTRPELAEKPEKSIRNRTKEMFKQNEVKLSKKKQAEAILAQYGIAVKL